jgi:hypothetical protein
MEYFNHYVNKLPLSLTHLVLSHYYRYPLDHLSPNLKSLMTGILINKQCSNSTHQSFTHCLVVMQKACVIQDYSES